MEYTYSKKNLKEWLFSNIDTLLDDCKFQALIVEVKAAEDAGSNFVNKTGHDEVHKIKGKIETKFTNYIVPDNTLRINSAGENKRNGFNLLRIIDGVNERIFEIPHNEYFNRGKRYGNEFKWSPTYNKEDKIQINNTQLLLDYEVTK
tara:strand:- start:130 stop:570 length:441 start_codon:yes stop_codon:yes gene_type:complete